MEKFPRSQHRPSLITPTRFAHPVPSKPVKRWNFRKAKWIHYILSQTNLPGLCRHLIHMKWIRHISVSVTPSALWRKVYPTWPTKYLYTMLDTECENLHQTFSQYLEGHDSSRGATALLARFDRQWKDRWAETVQNIDFSHSSQVARSTLNNLTGRS